MAIDEAKSKGIPLAFFNKHSSLMSNKREEIRGPIYEAFGVHVKNTKESHYVSWHLFLRMNAHLNFHCASKQD